VVRSSQKIENPWNKLSAIGMFISASHFIAAMTQQSSDENSPK
jgi:hypothetical protein